MAIRDRCMGLAGLDGDEFDAFNLMLLDTDLGATDIGDVTLPVAADMERTCTLTNSESLSIVFVAVHDGALPSHFRPTTPTKT